MTGIYRFAGIDVSFTSLYDEVHDLCSEYRTDVKTPVFCISTDKDDISFERSRSASSDEKEGIAVREFSDSYLETLAVYRKIAEKLPEYDAFLFHGSCIAVDGEGYLFTAKSGTGKSTHARLWRELLGDRAVMINDDKPIIRFTGDELRIYGTPWDGKHRLSTNISVPLKAICILERDAENSIEKISFRDCYSMLLQQSYRPFSNSSLAKHMMLIDRLENMAGFYRLKCNMDIEAAKTSYEAMKGNI